MEHNPLPKKFAGIQVPGAIANLEYEVLDQTGDEVLLKACPLGGGPAFYEALTVHYDQAGFYSIRPGAMTDLHNPNANARNLEVMTRVHQRRIDSVVSREGQKQRELEAIERDKQKLREEEAWTERVAELKTMKHRFVFDLKQLVRENSNNEKLLKNKAMIELSGQIDLIENILKYGKSESN